MDNCELCVINKIVKFPQQPRFGSSSDSLAMRHFTLRTNPEKYVIRGEQHRVLTQAKMATASGGNRVPRDSCICSTSLCGTGVLAVFLLFGHAHNMHTHTKEVEALFVHMVSFIGKQCKNMGFGGILKRDALGRDSFLEFYSKCLMGELDIVLSFSQ
jgi:hypothetical protein